MPKTANSVNMAGVTCVKSVFHAATGVGVGIDEKCVRLQARFYVKQILLQFFVTSAHLHI